MGQTGILLEVYRLYLTVHALSRKALALLLTAGIYVLRCCWNFLEGYLQEPWFVEKPRAGVNYCLSPFLSVVGKKNTNLTLEEVNVLEVSTLQRLFATTDMYRVP